MALLNLWSLGHFAQWGIIGYGVVILIFASFTLGLAMMPGLMFAIPAASMAERGNKIGSYLFNFLKVDKRIYRSLMPLTSFFYFLLSFY